MTDFRWYCWQGAPTPEAISMGGNLWRRLQVNYGEGWCDIPCVWQIDAEQQAERERQAKVMRDFYLKTAGAYQPKSQQEQG